MLSSSSFILLHFTFRSVIYFEVVRLFVIFVCVKGVRSVYRFIFFACGMFSCSSTTCWKGYLFFCGIALAPLSEISLLCSCRSISRTLYSILIIYLSILFSTTLSWVLLLCINSKSSVKVMSVLLPQ